MVENNSVGAEEIDTYPMDTYPMEETSRVPSMLTKEQWEKIKQRPDFIDRKTYKYNKYDYAILKNMWSLDKNYKHRLDAERLFICTVEEFLEATEEESYPETWKDIFHMEGYKYHITYHFTSGAFLAEEDPKQMVAIKVRVNIFNKFYCCIVRKFEENWTAETMKTKYNAIEL